MMFDVLVYVAVLISVHIWSSGTITAGTLRIGLMKWIFQCDLLCVAKTIPFQSADASDPLSLPSCQVSERIRQFAMPVGGPSGDMPQLWGISMSSTRIANVSRVPGFSKECR